MVPITEELIEELQLAGHLLIRRGNLHNKIRMVLQRLTKMGFTTPCAACPDHLLKPEDIPTDEILAILAD